VSMARRPRLLILTTNVGESLGGTERVVISLTRAFMARGWLVRYSFPCIPRRAELLQWCREAGFEATADPAVLTSETPHTLRRLLTLSRFIRARRPDVVNLHYGWNFIRLRDVLAVRLAGRSRLVVTMHQQAPWKGPGAPYSPRKRRVLTGVASLLCDKVVVVSHGTYDVLRQAGVPKAKLRLIYSGVRMPTTRPSRDDARARLGLALTAFVIVTLARLVPEKGVADLIEAVARVPDPYGELVLLIGGDGPERGELERLAVTRLGDRATFLGWIHDTADLYAAADVFALPSHMEGFGLVYVEAAFHGVPSIGTKVGGIPDAVADEETGLLVPVGDWDALVAAIARLRDDHDLRLRLGKSAAARAYAEFTEEGAADRYAALFR